ncbi:hypothetical protein BDZ89DRAFT_1157728 [Hymenopellis radicata]|nr:hypothetical protein BDZ89DRAFT_1157728 [Hymenopellis radicata]
MDAQSQSQSLALFEAVQHLRLVTYFDVSATALYVWPVLHPGRIGAPNSRSIQVFDYLLTLEQEVELIWASEWTITKLLYLVTRYSPFVNAGVFLWQQVTPNMSAENCVLVFKLNGWMATAGIILAEVILTLRTWAVWNRHRFLTVCMPALFLAHCVVVFTVMGIFLNSVQFPTLPLPDLKGCLLSAANPIYRWDFITSMIYEVGEYHRCTEYYYSVLTRSSHATTHGLFDLAASSKRRKRRKRPKVLPKPGQDSCRDLSDLGKTDSVF